MLSSATAVYRAVLIFLVVAFLIKLGMALFALAAVKGASGAALAGGIQKAGFISLKPLFAKLGGGSAFKGVFSSFSAGVKAKDVKKLKAQLDTVKKEETEGGVFSKLNAFWNECPVS